MKSVFKTIIWWQRRHNKTSDKYISDLFMSNICNIYQSNYHNSLFGSHIIINSIQLYGLNFFHTYDS